MQNTERIEQLEKKVKNLTEIIKMLVGKYNEMAKNMNLFKKVLKQHEQKLKKKKIIVS